MLTPSQIKLFHRGLLEAFTASDLESLLRNDIGVPPELIVGPNASMSSVAFDVIQTAERAGWMGDLVRSAYKARPAHKDFADLYQAAGFGAEISLESAGEETAAAAPLTNLSKDLKIQSQLIDVGSWLERLTAIEGHVCRVEVDKTSFGTGLLVAPDLVLTAYHVIESLHGSKSADIRPRVRFDYRVSGHEITPGVVVPVSEADWLVDHAPAGSDAAEHSASAKAEDLDYALLRLAWPVGSQPRDASSDRGLLRGWFPFPRDDHPMPNVPTLLIMQFTEAGPLKLVLDTDSKAHPNTAGTRVLYATSTQPGAGGAPCFSTDWDLIAIHQARMQAADGSRGLGQGIPIADIRARMARVGSLSRLTGIAAPPQQPPPASDVAPEPGPIVHQDDPQKNRWGGSSERNGRRLGVSDVEFKRRYFSFNIEVSSIDGTVLAGPVIFHLHDTFQPQKITVRKIRHGKAALVYEVLSYGVFTIGAQVRGARSEWIGLEFDLSSLSDLPERFRK